MFFAKVYMKKGSSHWMPSFVWRPSRCPKGLAFFTERPRLIDFILPQIYTEQDYDICEMGKDIRAIDYLLYISSLQFKTSPTPINWMDMPVFIDPVDTFGAVDCERVKSLHEFIGQALSIDILGQSAEIAIVEYEGFAIYVGSWKYGAEAYFTSVALRGCGSTRKNLMAAVIENKIPNDNKVNVVFGINNQSESSALAGTKRSVKELVDFERSLEGKGGKNVGIGQQGDDTGNSDKGS